MTSHNESLLLQRYIPTGYMKSLLSLVAEHPIIAQLIILAIITVAVCLIQAEKPNNGLFTANKLFQWEPAIMARLRWITNAQDILWAADKKVRQNLIMRSLLPDVNILNVS